MPDWLPAELPVGCVLVAGRIVVHRVIADGSILETDCVT
jgi:hypothetical protein